jgi:hypothetical protein
MIFLFTNVAPISERWLSAAGGIACCCTGILQDCFWGQIGSMCLGFERRALARIYVSPNKIWAAAIFVRRGSLFSICIEKKAQRELHLFSGWRATTRSTYDARADCAVKEHHGPKRIDLHRRRNMQIVLMHPLHETLPVPGIRLFAPGEDNASILWAR